jgi:hypothetical protein
MSGVSDQNNAARFAAKQAQYPPARNSNNGDASEQRQSPPFSWPRPRPRRVRISTPAQKPEKPSRAAQKPHICRGSDSAVSSSESLARRNWVKKYEHFTRRDWQELKACWRCRDFTRWVGDYIEGGEGSTYFVTVKFWRSVTEDEVKKRVAKWLRRLRGYRKQYLISGWVRLIEPCALEGWHAHIVLRLVGEDVSRERRELTREIERAREAGEFGRVRTERVRSVTGLARYFVKTLKLGAERANGYPITFSKNVRKRRWWEPVETPNAVCWEWMKAVVQSAAFEAALAEISADVDI